MKSNARQDLFLSSILGVSCFEIISLEKSFIFPANSFFYYRFSFSPKIIDICHQKNFYYSASTLVFKKINLEAQTKKNKFEVSFSKNVKKNDVYFLNQIAKLLSSFGRYSQDKYLKKNSDRIYQQWVYNSFFKKYADDFVIVRHKEKLIGFCTIKIQNKDIRINLIGVNKNYQGKGIGKMLLVNLFKKYPKRTFYAGTNSQNTNAINFYIKNGFVFDSHEVVFHRFT